MTLTVETSSPCMRIRKELSVRQLDAHIRSMQNSSPHFLALPSRGLEFLPKSLQVPSHAVALQIERPPNRRHLRAVAAVDQAGKAISPRSLPRSLRRISAKGFIPGRYGWPRARYVHSFADWTIYGHAETQHDTRADHLIVTQDLIAHAQKLLDHSLIIRQIATSRYGTPIYGMPPEMEIIPVYLRKPIAPPSSAHARMEQIARFAPQLAIIQRLLALPVEGTPEITWLPAENYVH